MATITTYYTVGQVKDANGEWIDQARWQYTDAATQTTAQNLVLDWTAKNVGRAIRRQIDLNDLNGNSITTDTVYQARDEGTVAVTASKRKWRQMITYLSTYGDPDIRALVDAARTACGWTS